MNELGPDEGDEELARHLRGRVGDEFRAEAEEGERLAELARMRGRDLTRLVSELRDRGDRVSLTVGGRTFVGCIVEVAGDRCAMDTSAGSVEVALGAPVHLTVVDPHVADPPPAAPRPTSFRARLHQLEMDGVEVEVGAIGLREPLLGTIVAVADDHLVVDDRTGQRWYVSRAGLAYVLIVEDAG